MLPVSKAEARMAVIEHRTQTPTRESDVGATPRAAEGWRRWLPWALVVLAAVIALAGCLNVWLKRQALSTDNWTQASSNLLANSEIRGALSVYLVDQIYENVDVAQLLADKLPPATEGLAAPLAASLRQPAVRSAD